jgi:ubiquinone/menaquinone biosynthesis C-methylase UbiE
MATHARTPDYGIDAPKVIRNLVIAAIIAFLIALASLVGFLPKQFVLHPTPSTDLRFPLVPLGLWPGLGFACSAGFMYFGSKFGKVAERDKLLNRIQWRGDERVLDVGCGRGLVLVGAARRLDKGSAVGIDIWQEEDLSGNRAEVPLRNAEIEGVADRVSVRTADMRRLPFEDCSFDVVTSRAAIHNLYSRADRAIAVREIARVLRPGGRAVIVDIRHLQEYARVFAEHGCPEVRLLESKVGSAFYAIVTMGALRPNTIVAQKSE